MTQSAIVDFLSENTLPAVIDADAIHALAKNPVVIKGERSIVTPNLFEFRLLTGRDVQNLSDEDKAQVVQAEALKLQATIVLKGRNDIISDGKEVAINKTGGPYLAKGGTGDSLAGIAGALLARGVEPFLAAQAAAYINGLAGETVAKKIGESLTAIDLIETIPEVIR